ncbi:hypothetical protein LG302_01070 [Halomonas organivorans]
MKQYDLIYWGWDEGKKHRGRDPLIVRLDKPLYEGQRIEHGEIPELDAKELRYPIEVTEVTTPETAGSDRAFHLVESRPVPGGLPGGEEPFWGNRFE